MSATAHVDLDAQPLPHSLVGVVHNGAESIDMWEYFVDHVDEFAVAKTIVDYFDAAPADLHNEKIGIDVFALYLRAKITLKRNAVAYAEGLEAIERAKLASHGLGPKIRAVRSFCRELRQAASAQPEYLVILALIAAVALMR
jgi:hypothetical protein